LTILIALEAQACPGLRVLSERALSSADGLEHFQVLIDDHRLVFLGSLIRTFRYTFAHEELVARV